MQVPTPAPQRPEAKQPTPISSAAVSTTKADEASRARRCDVSASPIKVRDSAAAAVCYYSVWQPILGSY